MAGQFNNKLMILLTSKMIANHIRSTSIPHSEVNDMVHKILSKVRVELVRYNANHWRF